MFCFLCVVFVVMGGVVLMMGGVAYDMRCFLRWPVFPMMGSDSYDGWCFLCVVLPMMGNVFL